MMTDSWKLDEEGEAMLKKLDALESKFPHGVSRGIARGARSIFLRSRGVLVRFAGGEPTGAWILRPPTIALAFDARHAEGFAIQPSTADGDRPACVPVLAKRGLWTRAVDEAMRQVGSALEATWRTPGATAQHDLDTAREAFAQTQLADFRSHGSAEHKTPAPAIEEPKPRRYHVGGGPP